MKKIVPYIHPFLFSLYPLVFLYSRNIHEYPENVLLAPCAIVLIFATIVFALFHFLFKNIQKASLISFLFIFICLSYGSFLGYLSSLNTTTYTFVIYNGNLFFIPAILLFLVPTFFIVRTKTNLYSANKLLTIISLGLIVVSLFNILSFEVQTKRLIQTPSVPAPTKKNVTLAPLRDVPDIYYFMIEEYAGPRSGKNEYNFDNSQFFNFLKNKGFYLAEDATTNYPKTFLSLGSSFNMEYLDFLTVQTNGGASSDQSIVTPLIQNGKVIQFLKSKGYSFINIGPLTWTPTSKNPYADKNYVMPNKTYPRADAFTTGFLNRTILSPILSYVFHDSIDVSIDPNNNIHRKLALFEFNAAEQAISLKSPKFVFVHILLPHDPFVFDEDCTPVPESEAIKRSLVLNYLDQLKCANTKIEKIITDVISKSKKPPVIVLQSDEGPFPMKSPLSPDESWSTADIGSYREKFPILNAYYMPGVSHDQLYPSITPVNSFKVIFNAYFGTNYVLLPDRNYIFQDDSHYYKFSDVTGKVH